MSGFGTCPACGRKGFTRRGADRCTRCEKAPAQPIPVAVVETVTVAEVPAETMMEIVAESREAQATAEPELAPPVRAPRKRRPYYRSMGRIVFNDDDEEG